MAERTSAPHRFFVEPSALAGGTARLVGDQAHQMARVLRLRPGERIVLLDGSGTERVVELTAVAPKLVEGVVREARPSLGEPRLRVVLYQGVVAREKLEWVIQKATEVGVSAVAPVLCERSAVPRGEWADERRLERWRRIATEAAEQSGRGVVPEVRAPRTFAEAVAEAVATGPALVAWEGERARSAREGLRRALGAPGPGDGLAPRPSLPDRGSGGDAGDLPASALLPSRSRGKGAGDEGRPRPVSPDLPSSLGLFIGPEGGLSEREAGLAAERGALTVSLGPRILRTETAGPVLAALALYEAGDLAPLPAPDAGDRAPHPV